MTWTTGDVIAIVAIGVGGLVTVSGVYIASRQARGARIQDRRTEAYVRIFRIVSQITVQADQHAFFPGKASESDPEKGLEQQAGAEMALMGSENARNKYELWRKEIFAYWPLVNAAATAALLAEQTAATAALLAEQFLAKDSEKREQKDHKPLEFDVAGSKAEEARMKLGKPMEEITKRINGLEDVLREESQSAGWIRH
jgi:hypothetical protein